MAAPRNHGGHKGGAPASASLGIVHTPAERIRVSGEFLPRERLTRTLQNARTKLVLFSAPPGFGKTTLLSQWRAIEQRPFASLSIEAADNYLILFWTRILEAIRAAEPRFESAAQIALRAPEADVVGAVLPLLSHDLRLLDHEFVLALDDYQNIVNPACHESLRLFLHWLPRTVTIGVSTRSDPPIALGTRRAQGELLEFRALDLCFTAEEESAYLNDRLGLGLDAPTLKTLHGRTEGWPAGVHLASLSLQRADDRAEFVAEFNGTNRHVVDYLTEVVLESIDDGVGDFLRDTSVLESVCAPLADAVTGRDDSAELLEELERSNLFLVALDDRREWYRYHQLFRELLRAQFSGQAEARLPTLHLRAFRWYADAGRTGDAIRHGLAAGASVGTRDLVAERWVPRLDRSAAELTLTWLDAFPAEDVAGDARLLLAKAWGAALTNRPEDGLRALELARELGLDVELPCGSSLASAGALLEACFPHGDAGRMLVAARRCREFERELAPALLPLSHLALGWAEYLAGNAAAAEPSLRTAVTSSADLEEWLHVAISNALLAHLALAAGDHELATLLARDAATATAKRSGDPEPLAAGMADVANGAVLAHSDVKAAEAVLDRGLTRLRVHGEPLLVAEALLLLAPVRRGLQGTEAGRACLEEARETLDRCADPGALQDRLEQVARSLTPAYRRHAASELTERELEVLRYLAEGISKRDIGTALFLSYNTIHSHTKSIYQKLRVSSRQAAVERARELGVL